MDEQDEAIKDFLLKLGHTIESDAKFIAPVREGHLKADIQVFDNNISNLEIAVGNSKLIHYAPFVHGGTGIHGPNKKRITPKNKKALKTPYGIFKSVAGMRANPYLNEAFKTLQKSPRLDYMLDELGDKIEDDFFDALSRSLKTIKVS